MSKPVPKSVSRQIHVTGISGELIERIEKLCKADGGRSVASWMRAHLEEFVSASERALEEKRAYAQIRSEKP